MDAMFNVLLFISCFYFAYHDFMQINSTNNGIVMWAYINFIPLLTMLFINIYTSFYSDSPELEKIFYSLTAFLIWTRIVHLMKLFDNTSHLLRMGGEILFRMRWLICFIVISLLSSGFVFYFLSEDDK